MKKYKRGDVVIVRKKDKNFIHGWTDNMDEYLGVKSVVLGYYKSNESIRLVLKRIYDNQIGDINFLRSYVFPLKSIDNRKEKIKRLLEHE